jgi:hypothetical protein
MSKQTTARLSIKQTNRSNKQRSARRFNSSCRSRCDKMIENVTEPPKPKRCEGLGRGLGFYVVPHGGHRSAPRVIATLAGFVHNGQSAADYKYNHDNDD